MHRLTRIIALVLSLALVAAAGAGQIEIKLKDGSKWRGQTNDTVQIEFMLQGSKVMMEGKVTKEESLYIMVNGQFAGQAAQKPIFKADIVSMKTLAAASADAGDAAVPAANPGDGPGASEAPADATPTNVNDKSVGVFVLPMKGTVGEGFRHDEIEKLAKHCDQFGPGQIIVLEIESGGGLEIEMEKIHYSIVEIRKRHRVVSWIKEAISAAAATASNCDEIYFYKTGTLGAMTGFAGGVSKQGEELQQWLRIAGDWMEAGGRSRYIAEAMIDDEKLLSYDKDPATGEVTWHNDLSGKVVLSDSKTNLTFTSSTAMDSKFADGVADTGEELAKLLNLPAWHEKDDYGRKISKEWLDTVAEAKERIPILAARTFYEKRSNGDKAFVGNQIKIYQELLRWWDKCPNVCFLLNVPSKDQVKNIIEELKRQLARMS